MDGDAHVHAHAQRVHHAGGLRVYARNTHTWDGVDGGGGGGGGDGGGGGGGGKPLLFILFGLFVSASATSHTSPSGNSIYTPRTRVACARKFDLF